MNNFYTVRICFFAKPGDAETDYREHLLFSAGSALSFARKCTRCENVAYVMAINDETGEILYHTNFGSDPYEAEAL